MANDFIAPSFDNGEIELRFENDEICIYGTSKGLKKLSDFCLELINNPKSGHIHLEDYEVLTNNSLIGVLAIFSKK